MLRPSVRLMGLVGCILTLAACAPWTPSSAVVDKWLLPPRSSPDSVVVDVALVDVSDPHLRDQAALWDEVDEQQFPVTFRRRLASAGIRCGVIATELPDWLRDETKAQQVAVSLDQKDGTAVISDLQTRRRIQCRPGRRQYILVRKARDELILRRSGDQGPSDEKYHDAECGLAMTAEPLGDGRVRLQLVAEIHHGRSHQRWVGDQGLFRMDAARDSRKFDDLKIEATLFPGHALVLAPTPDATGIGQTFFLGQQESDPCPRIVLVRLLQTQFDDLFTPTQTSTPIVTPDQ